MATNNQVAKWTIAVLVVLLLIPVVGMLMMWGTGAGMSGGMGRMMNGGMGGMMAFGWMWMILVPVAVVLLIALLIRGVSRT